MYLLWIWQIIVSVLQTSENKVETTFWFLDEFTSETLRLDVRLLTTYQIVIY